MKPNPPIKGHKLLNEGHATMRLDPVTELRMADSYGCECGERPYVFMGVNATKKWHRRHKDELRAAAS